MGPSLRLIVHGASSHLGRIRDVRKGGALAVDKLASSTPFHLLGKEKTRLQWRLFPAGWLLSARWRFV